jgi:hypothetical protein
VSVCPTLALRLRTAAANTPGHDAKPPLRSVR